MGSIKVWGELLSPRGIKLMLNDAKLNKINTKYWTSKEGIGYKMWTAQEGDAPVINITAGHYFRQSLWITLLNPKAIMFYMAFFPLFIDPQAHAGLWTFGVMALTVAALTFLYGLLICILAQRLSTRLQQRPWLGRALQKIGGGLLVAFGLKIVLSK
jgi:threonine/homoserine/homoserine lactone efflux protein